MGSLPGRFVVRAQAQVTSLNLANPDWVSGLFVPRELALIRVAPVGSYPRSRPVAWVTPWVLAVDGEVLPLGHAQCQVMGGVKTIISRAAVDPSSELRQASPPGQLNWGLQLHLIGQVRTAEVTYWQWT